MKVGVDFTMSNNFKKVFVSLFLVGVFLVLGLFYSLVFRTQKDISIEENRTLQKMPRFLFSEFVTGEFQNKLENAISDQMLASMEIKYTVKSFYNFLTANFSSTNTQLKKILAKGQRENNTRLDKDNKAKPEQEKIEKKEPAREKVPEQKDKGQYTYTEVVANKIYKLDDSGYLVRKPSAPEDYCFERYAPSMLAKITYPKYLFFIMTSQSADFNDLQKYKTLDYIKTKMPMTDYDMLSYKSFDEYKKYFYQTDHHWNYYGSYIGYTKIMKMLEGEDVKLLEPVGTHTYDVVFYGSLDREGALSFSNEKFKVYLFDIPKYTTYCDDEKREYNSRYRYTSDKEFPSDKYSDHYNIYYGGGCGKVVFDFDCPEKESILIVGSSFTNPIVELVGSHYNKTHFINPWYFSEIYGYDFVDIESYMEENNLSKLLLIGDINGF
ncbi:MAG: hypothetical protein P1P64_02040 [Treponemataceae bacterium]